MPLPSSKLRYHVHELLLRLETMLELVLLGLVPCTHFGEQLHRAKLVGKFNLAALRVEGVRQAVIGGNFADGSFQDLNQVLNCLVA